MKQTNHFRVRFLRPKLCFQLLQQEFVIRTASEATELEHEKTFEELSDTKNEEIVASNQEAQETKTLERS